MRADTDSLPTPSGDLVDDTPAWEELRAKLIAERVLPVLQSGNGVAWSTVIGALSTWSQRWPHLLPGEQLNAMNTAAGAILDSGTEERSWEPWQKDLYRAATRPDRAAVAGAGICAMLVWDDGDEHTGRCADLTLRLVTGGGGSILPDASQHWFLQQLSGFSEAFTAAKDAVERFRPELTIPDDHDVVWTLTRDPALERVEGASMGLAVALALVRLLAEYHGVSPYNALDLSKVAATGEIRQEGGISRVGGADRKITGELQTRIDARRLRLVLYPASNGNLTDASSPMCKILPVNDIAEATRVLQDEAQWRSNQRKHVRERCFRFFQQGQGDADMERGYEPLPLAGPDGRIADQASDFLLEETAGLNRGALIVVTGDGGTGKSTLMQHLAWRSASSDTRVPVLMDLGEAETLRDLRPGNGDLGAAARRGELLVLLDGLDELDDVRVPSLKDTILQPAIEGGCSVVLTSRPAALERHSRTLGPFTHECRLLPLDNGVQKRFIQQRLAASTAESLLQVIADSPELADLLTIPLHLAIACSLVNRGVTIDATTTRTQLIQWHVLSLMATTRRASDPDDPIDDAIERAECRLSILAAAAFSFLAGGKREFAGEDLRESIRPAAEREGYSPYRLISDWSTNYLLHASGNLNRTYRFSHLMVHDFLAAWALKEGLRRGEDYTELVDRRVWDPDWDEVWAFAAGLLGRDAELLVRHFLDESKDDVLRHRLGHALRCLSEIPAGSPLHGEVNSEVDRAVAWFGERGAEGLLTHLGCALTDNLRREATVEEAVLAKHGPLSQWSEDAWEQSLDRLLSPSWRERRAYRRILNHPDARTRVEQFLRTAAESDDPVRRTEGVRAIGEFGLAQQFLGPLTEFALGENPDVAVAALAALCDPSLLESNSQDVTGVLARAAVLRPGARQVAALYAIGLVTPADAGQGRNLVAATCTSLGDCDESVRHGAAITAQLWAERIETIDHDDIRLLQDICERDPSERVRLAAQNALRRWYNRVELVFRSDRVRNPYVLRSAVQVAIARSESPVYGPGDIAFGRIDIPPGADGGVFLCESVWTEDTGIRPVNESIAVRCTRGHWISGERVVAVRGFFDPVWIIIRNMGVDTPRQPDHGTGCLPDLCKLAMFVPGLTPVLLSTESIRAEGRLSIAPHASFRECLWRIMEHLLPGGLAEDRWTVRLLGSHALVDAVRSSASQFPLIEKLERLNCVRPSVVRQLLQHLCAKGEEHAIRFYQEALSVLAMRSDGATVVAPRLTERLFAGSAPERVVPCLRSLDTTGTRTFVRRDESFRSASLAGLSAGADGPGNWKAERPCVLYVNAAPPGSFTTASMDFRIDDAIETLSRDFDVDIYEFFISIHFVVQREALVGQAPYRVIFVDFSTVMEMDQAWLRTLLCDLWESIHHFPELKIVAKGLDRCGFPADAREWRPHVRRLFAAHARLVGDCAAAVREALATVRSTAATSALPVTGIESGPGFRILDVQIEEHQTPPRAVIKVGENPEDFPWSDWLFSLMESDGLRQMDIAVSPLSGGTLESIDSINRLLAFMASADPQRTLILEKKGTCPDAETARDDLCDAVDLVCLALAPLW